MAFAFLFLLQMLCLSLFFQLFNSILFFSFLSSCSIPICFPVFLQMAFSFFSSFLQHSLSFLPTAFSFLSFSFLPTAFSFLSSYSILFPFFLQHSLSFFFLS